MSESNVCEKSIGIVTFNNANNYGALCQEYALQMWLAGRGITSDVINLENKEFDYSYRYYANIIKKASWKGTIFCALRWMRRPWRMYQFSKREKLFDYCRRQEIHETKKLSDDELPGIVDDYACFISGSDQVWNTRLNQNKTAYFLDFIPIEKSYKKLSYAASMDPESQTFDDAENIKHLLSDFASVLVREKSVCEYLNSECGISSQVTIDPVLLLDRSDWDKFADKSKWNKCSDYIFVYILAPGDEIYKKAIEYSARTGTKLIFVRGDGGVVKIDGKKYTSLIGIGPYEFVDIIRNAKCIYTTSFHGVAFSIIYEKQFIYEASSKAKNMSRVFDLLDMLELGGRSIEFDMDNYIDWHNVERHLNDARKKSGDLLLDSIKKAFERS